MYCLTAFLGTYSQILPQKVTPMQYRYSIADICTLCTIPYPMTIHPESQAFLFPLAENKPLPPADLTMNFLPVPEISGDYLCGHREVNTFFLRDSDRLRVYFCPAPGREPYACVHWPDAGNTVTCFYDRGKERYINFSRNISELIGLETLLLHFGGLLLHSSFIRHQSRGIVFSAPSGIGKSTQANLWQKFRGSEILNGDRAAIRFVDNCWRAYGLPYAGSSGIYRNESAPLSAIVVLRQAMRNSIRILSPAQAMGCLLPEFNLHRWDAVFMEQAVTQILSLIQVVPVYLLECLPDRGAVDLLHNTIF